MLLRLDVHLPPPESWPVPIVVTRTPYGRSRHLAEGAGWIERGIGFVVSDVRGRYDSDGIWCPYRHERSDGAALIDWIIAQPWSNGRVIGYGGSYAAYTAWMLAVERPQYVAGVASFGPSLGLATTKYDPSGVLRLAEHAAWWLERGDARTSRDGLTAHVFARQPDLLLTLPVTHLATDLGANLPGLNDTIDPAELAGEDRIDDAELAGLNVDSLHIGGWYDLLLAQTTHLHDAVGSALTPRPARSLIIGPWEHDLTFTRTTQVGAREHGDASLVDTGALLTQWLDRVLRRPGNATEPPSGTGRPVSELDSRIFVIGSGSWLGWPPESIEVTLSTGGAGLAAGGGVRVDRFSYDPRDPYPSRPAAVDRRDLLGRRDVARLWTAPLPTPLTIAGRPSVALHATSEAPTVDWTARLLHRAADGTVTSLAAGTVVAAGDQRTHDIELGLVAAELELGSCLGLEVTTSDFPDLARNLNTAKDRYRSQDTRVAHQNVRWGPGRTAITLPVVGNAPPWPGTSTLTAVHAHTTPAQTGPAPLTPAAPASNKVLAPATLALPAGELACEAQLVDPVTGVLTDVHRMPTDSGMPSAWVAYGAHTARTERWASWRADAFGFGAALGDERAARAAAIGEAVERYCGNAVPAGLPVASWNDLNAAGHDAIDPHTLGLHSATQYAQPGFPFVPFTRDLSVAWAAGTDLRTGAARRVPASLTWLNYFHGPRQHEPATHSLMYSGIATGTDRAGAERTAVLELLERDATTIWWASGAPATRLDDHGRVLGMLGRPGTGDVEITLLAIPSPFQIPVVAAFLHDHAADHVAFGSACRLDEAAAARKALVEAFGLLQLTRQLDDPAGEVWRAVSAGEIASHVFLPYRADRRYLDDVDADWRRLTDLPPIAQLYLDERMQARLDRLRPTVSRPLAHSDKVPNTHHASESDSDPNAAYRDVLDRLAEQDIYATSIELTTADVASARLRVVRVVAPGLVGNAPPAFPLLGAARLLTEPRRLGLTDRDLTEHDLVRQPLPLA